MMLLTLLCLASVAHARRIEKVASHFPRNLARGARHAIKQIQRQSVLLGTHAFPAIATKSRLLHASKRPLSPEEPLVGRPELPDKKWPPEGFKSGQTVRHVASNEEYVILGFGQNVIECQSKYSNDRSSRWFQPDDLSHKLEKLKADDPVIVIATGRQGRVMPHGDGHPSSLMRVDFVELGVRTVCFYDQSELKRPFDHSELLTDLHQPILSHDEEKIKLKQENEKLIRQLARRGVWKKDESVMKSPVVIDRDGEAPIVFFLPDASEYDKFYDLACKKLGEERVSACMSRDCVDAQEALAELADLEEDEDTDKTRLQMREINKRHGQEG